MAYTDVQICNLALSYLGDIATVASISAPSTQQEKWCATFYPMARDITLEKHNWSFATVRKALSASVVVPPSTWTYAYDVPANTVNFLEILDPNAVDDLTTPVNFTTIGSYVPPIIPNLGVATGYAFVIEWDETNTKQVLYTDLAAAVGRYTIAATDPSKWPMSFIETVAYRLASYLAGPLLKGDVGYKVSQTLGATADKKQMDAEASDASSRQVALASGAPWMVNR